MFKKLLLSAAILIFSFHFAEAQKYKVKKRTGVVSKDKEEVARVEGSVSVFKKSYMDMYQNDELVLSLKEKSWNSPYKEFDSFLYYSMDFPKLGESFHIKAGYSFANEKQIIKLLLADNGLHIYEEGFKLEEIQLMKNSQAVLSVERDTLRYQGLLADWRSALSDEAFNRDHETFDGLSILPLPKDRNKRPQFLPRETTHLVYRKITDEDVIRDYKREKKSTYRLLGSIAYKNHVAQTGQMTATNEIRIFRRVNTTIDYNGEKTKFAPIAYTDINASGLNGSQGENEYILYLDDSLQKYDDARTSITEEVPFEKRAMKILQDLEQKDLI